MVASAKVITTEQDFSTVAPSISSTIVAVLGAAKKGPVNERVFVSTPDDFISKFGEPIPTSFMGYAALNYLRQGNQLWVVRVASESGDDPVSVANTDTPATYTSGAFDVSDFPITGNLEIQFDGGTPIAISLNATNAGDIDTLVKTLNATFSSFTPKVATAAVVDGNKVSITTQSKNGPLSTIDIVSSPVPQFAGSAQGERMVKTAMPLTAAQITSTTGTSLDTTTVNAAVKGRQVPVGRTFNVSKQPREAYGIIGVNNSAAFTVATQPYNQGTITINSNPNNGDTLTVTWGSTATTFTFVNTAPTTNTQVLIGLTTADTAQNLADALNNAQIYAVEDGVRVPAVNLKASVAGSDLILTQITPPSFTSKVQVQSSATSWADFTNSSGTVDLGNTPSGDSHELDGGDSGADYIRIDIPDSITAPGVESGNTNVPVSYFFVAAQSATGLGTFDASPTNTISQIAASLADAIDTHDAYFPFDDPVNASLTAKTYALSATQNGSQIKITTNPNITNGLRAQGNTIKVDLTNISVNAVSAVDLDSSSTLTHGFNDRLGTSNGGLNAEYSFAPITVDGVTKVINFDTIPSTIIPDKHEATIEEIIDAINYVFDDNVASQEISGSNTRLVITSPTPGAEGSVTVGSPQNIDAPYAVGTDGPAQTGTDSAQNETTGANTDLLDDSNQSYRTVVTPSGDNHLGFKVNGEQVEVYFTQSSNLSLTQAASEINQAAKAVNPLFESVASVENNAIVLTSPTKGALPDFNSTLEITNTFVPTSGPSFPNLVFAQGTGTKRASIRIEAASPGTWANDTIEVMFSDEDPLFSAPNSSRVDVYYKGSLVETFREIVVNPNADGTVGVNGQGVFIEDAINGVSEYIVVDFDDDLADTDPNTLVDSEKIVANTSVIGDNPPYKLSGGADGITGLVDADYIGVSGDNPTGLQLFANKDEVIFNLLAVPGATSQGVQNEMVSIAEARQDILVIIDPPYGLTDTQVVDWHNGLGYGRTAALNTSYAAMYSTWLNQTDPYNKIDIDLPPSAFILAQMAYNDKVAKPWFATAGLTRGVIRNANDIVVNPTEGGRDLMQGQGNRVNPIVKFPREGIVIWGNNTLYRQESALSEITVRRMLNTAKTLIELGTKVILFEPNDPTSSQRLIEIINPVLDDIRRSRGLVTFKVVDATTANDRNLGRVVIKIFLQPTRAIKEIEIPFILTGEGGSFAE